MKPHNASYQHPRSAPTGNGKSGFYQYNGNQPWRPKGTNADRG